MKTLDYAIYDADNHYYEPDDCFTRHIEARYAQRTMWIDRKSDGPGRMYVGDERCHFFSVGTGDSIGPPGIMKEFLRGNTEEGGSPSLNPIENCESMSSFRSSFAVDYGLKIAGGPLQGLCSRAVIILDEDNKVIHSQQVPEIADEPDYEAALKVLS